MLLWVMLEILSHTMYVTSKPILFSFLIIPELGIGHIKKFLSIIFFTSVPHNFIGFKYVLLIVRWFNHYFIFEFVKCTNLYRKAK